MYSPDFFQQKVPLPHHPCHFFCFEPQFNKQQMGVSKNRGGPPKSSILIRFSIINHPFWFFFPLFLETPRFDFGVIWNKNRFTNATTICKTHIIHVILGNFFMKQKKRPPTIQQAKLGNLQCRHVRWSFVADIDLPFSAPGDRRAKLWYKHSCKSCRLTVRHGQITIFPSKYDQNGWFSMAILVLGRVQWYKNASPSWFKQRDLFKNPGSIVWGHATLRNRSRYIGRNGGENPWDGGPRPAVKNPPCWSPLKGDMGPNKYPLYIGCIWGWLLRGPHPKGFPTIFPHFPATGPNDRSPVFFKNRLFLSLSCHQILN